MVVNSLVTNIDEGQKFASGREMTVAGVAWDGGYGIASVEVSEDGGRTWRMAQFGPELGRFSWRQWSHRLTPQRRGSLTFMAKATNRAGATQTFDLIFNPAGYHNNVVQRINIEIT